MDEVLAQTDPNWRAGVLEGYLPLEQAETVASEGPRASSFADTALDAEGLATLRRLVRRPESGPV